MLEKDQFNFIKFSFISSQVGKLYYGQGQTKQKKNKREMQLVHLFCPFVLGNPTQFEDESSFKAFVLTTAARSLWTSVYKSDADLSKSSFVFGQSVGLFHSDSNCADLATERALPVRSDIHHRESSPVTKSPSADWQKQHHFLQNTKTKADNPNPSPQDCKIYSRDLTSCSKNFKTAELYKNYHSCSHAEVYIKSSFSWKPSHRPGVLARRNTFICNI